MTSQTSDTIVVGNNLMQALMSHPVTYSIDYYQRDYAWGEKEVSELLEDLFAKFDESYTQNDKPKDVFNYKQYFLGSYVLSRKDGKDYIIDGQQRLTTLTLLFLAIHHLSIKKSDTRERGDAYRHVVLSAEDDDIEFRISIEDRFETMLALLEGNPLEETNDPSNNLLWKNYEFICQYLDSRGVSLDQLKVFRKWLSDRVLMVSITAYNDSEAYTIFEAMNDRGKPLSQLDMFKGYLLSLVDNKDLLKASIMWDNLFEKFKKDQGEFSKFIIDFMRGRWAKSTSQTNSKNVKTIGLKNDWSEIHNHFHRFLRDNRFRKDISIKGSKDAIALLKQLDYYSDVFQFLELCGDNASSEFEDLFYLKNSKLPYVDLFFYSFIEPQDSIEERDLKIKIISKFLNLRLGAYTWNSIDSSNDGNTATYFVKLCERFDKLGEGKESHVLVWFLYHEIKEKTKKGGIWGGFSSTNTPYLNPNRNKGYVKAQMKYLLVNITAFLEKKATSRNIVSDFYENNYTIEHVLTSKMEINGYFDDQDTFDKYRNYAGALGLLPGTINSSYKDMEYTSKSIMYLQDNVLLGSLNSGMYNPDGTFANKPGLNKFVSENYTLKILFKPFSEFNADAIQKRNMLFAEISKHIWNIEDLAEFRDKTVFKSMDDLNNYIDKELPEDEAEEIESALSRKTKLSRSKTLDGMDTDGIAVSGNFNYELKDSLGNLMTDTKFRKLYARWVIELADNPQYRAVFHNLIKSTPSLFKSAAKVDINGRSMTHEVEKGLHLSTNMSIKDLSRRFQMIADKIGIAVSVTKESDDQND